MTFGVGSKVWFSSLVGGVDPTVWCVEITKRDGIFYYGTILLENGRVVNRPDQLFVTPPYLTEKEAMDSLYTAVARRMTNLEAAKHDLIASWFNFLDATANRQYQPPE